MSGFRLPSTYSMMSCGICVDMVDAVEDKVARDSDRSDLSRQPN